MVVPLETMPFSLCVPLYLIGRESGSGHVVEYTATPPAVARELLHGALDAWVAEVPARIDEFGGETA